MKVKLNSAGKSPIGATIRAIATAQSSRLFKSEVNSPERSALVFLVIRSEVALSLYDLGLSVEEMSRDVDPTDDILAQMSKDGYDLGLTQLLRQGVDNG